MPIEILMPALSPTMEEGTLSKWMIAEGDTVSSGDVLAEIETDKATMEVEAVEEGTVAKLLVPGGTEGVKVNAPIAILLEEDEDASALDTFEAGGAKPHSETFVPPRESGEPSRDPQSRPEQSEMDSRVRGNERNDGGNRIKASPLAKRIAADAGLDLAAISGSGPNGRIVKADVEAAKASGTQQAPKATQEAQKTAPTSDAGTMPSTKVLSGGADYLAKLGVESGSYDLLPLNNIQKVVASRLSASNTNVPDFPLTVDCEIDALLAMRKELNGQAPEGVKISVNDMLIRASALALKHVPEANASFTPDGVAMHHHADVAVAVAIDGGLITPIVRAAENKGLSTISSEMKDLAARARDRKLKPQEYQGGTFSISNLGMFGIREFGSIINEPHGMILSVGAGAPRPVVKDGAIAVATVMTVTLTCDHRVVDGALGAKWLQHFKRYVEQPITMML